MPIHIVANGVKRSLRLSGGRSGDTLPRNDVAFLSFEKELKCCIPPPPCTFPMAF